MAVSRSAVNVAWFVLAISFIIAAGSTISHFISVSDTKKYDEDPPSDTGIYWAIGGGAVLVVSAIFLGYSYKIAGIN